MRYPLRLFRYWFGYHLLREEYKRKGRPLDVAEVGVHTGQMLEFAAPRPRCLNAQVGRRSMP